MQKEIALKVRQSIRLEQRKEGSGVNLSIGIIISFQSHMNNNIPPAEIR